MLQRTAASLAGVVRERPLKKPHGLQTYFCVVHPNLTYLDPNVIILWKIGETEAVPQFCKCEFVRIRSA